MAADDPQSGFFTRIRGVLVRLLRAPAQNDRRFDEIDHRLGEVLHRDDERRGHAAHTEASLAALRGQIEAMTAQLQGLADEQVRARDLLNRLSVTTGHLAEITAIGSPPAPRPDGPLVSVILPVRDRPDPLRRALRSVLDQTHSRWKCIVVDDGSEPPHAVERIPELADERMRLIRLAGSGEAGARNVGFEAATGELVAFLDSDNWWLPDRLAGAVAALDGREDRWAIDRQLVVGADGQTTHVRQSDLPLATLTEANFVDIGMVVARRELLEEIRRPSGDLFDTSLQRLTDWDLALRLAAVEPPARIPHLGQVYDERPTDRVTAHRPLGPAVHQIRRTRRSMTATGLRVLLAEWHFPQVTETYIQSDVAGLRALGATVEAWSDEDVAVPYEPGIPVHRGRLEDVIAAFEPHVVLTHWLHIGRDLTEITEPLGLPHVVRGHGFDTHDQTLDELLRRSNVLVHLFPHLVGSLAGHPRVSVDPVAFDPDRVAPAVAKDRRLVFRTSAGLLTKDLEVFLLASLRCPEHRFLLNIGHTYQAEHRTDELMARAEELGARVEILLDLAPEKAAELTEQAGIYLHTHGDSHPLGQPISIAESMATGSYVIARDLPGMRDYLSGGGDLYRGGTPEARADHAAALVNATRHWDDERWAAQATAALDVAWSRHAADDVAARLVDTWRTRLGVRW